MCRYLYGGEAEKAMTPYAGHRPHALICRLRVPDHIEVR